MTYHRTQRVTRDNEGRTVYGVFCVRGGWGALAELSMSTEARLGVAQARGYGQTRAFWPPVATTTSASGSTTQGGWRSGVSSHAGAACARSIHRTSTRSSCLQQTQGASAQSGRAYDSAALASDRSHCYRFQSAGRQELLSPCRLCSNMTGIRSKLHFSSKGYPQLNTLSFASALAVSRT
jgi:uncharacterized protein DUF3182